MKKYDELDHQERLSYWNILHWEGLTPTGLHKASEFLRSLEGGSQCSG